RNVGVAFVPSAILGVLLKSRIDAMMETPVIVALALIGGGIAILLIERFTRHGPYEPVEALSLPRSAAIGLMQCLAMIPGVSRSGATIMGALAM
ncbi:undecaprenyl-diphosphate phosphatase, partial [Streptomyces scabiei]